MFAPAKIEAVDDEVVLSSHSESTASLDGTMVINLRTMMINVGDSWSVLNGGSMTAKWWLDVG